MNVLIAGVDEAGRGPLAGPVVAAAVILHPDRPIAGLADSKQLTPERRASLARDIKEKALAWAVGVASVAEIDRINILMATMLAMERALTALEVRPDRVLVDGNRCPKASCPIEAIVRGDASVPVIGAASIIAKVERDNEMVRLDALYPQYGFARNKGYPTPDHITRLMAAGPSAIHRQSFRPVAEAARIHDGDKGSDDPEKG